MYLFKNDYYLVISFTCTHVSKIWEFIPIYSCALVAALCGYLFIEAPFMKLQEKLFSRRND